MFLDFLEMMVFLDIQDKPGPEGSQVLTAVMGQLEMQGHQGNLVLMAHLVIQDNRAGRERRENLWS